MDLRYHRYLRKNSTPERNLFHKTCILCGGHWSTLISLSSSWSQYDMLCDTVHYPAGCNHYKLMAIERGTWSTAILRQAAAFIRCLACISDLTVSQGNIPCIITSEPPGWTWHKAGWVHRFMLFTAHSVTTVCTLQPRLRYSFREPVSAKASLPCY